MASVASPIRVLHVIDFCYPILGYQEIFLAREQGKLHETAILTSNRYANCIFEANKALLKENITGCGFSNEQGLKVCRLPTFFNFDTLDSPWLTGLEKNVKNYQPDIIIAHGLINLTSIRIAFLKSSLPKTKFIFDDHMTYNATRGGWTNLMYLFFKLIFSPFFKKSANAFVAVTLETKKFMQAFYGIPAEKITVIPLGIDTENFFFDKNARASNRKKLGINEDDIVFVYAGKIIPEKGVHLFVEAALQICKQNTHTKFLIVGGSDKDYLAILQRKINDANLRDRFFVEPAVPNRVLHEYYSAADVGVWPLQCSMTMLEATACGLPIIISNKSGANERIDFGNGLLYEESNVNDLIKKCIMLLDPQLRTVMSRKGREYAMTISWNTIAQKFLDLAASSDNHPIKT
jgi:glycosyltransferase involved in cell wall biosynthesis